ncbi:helix-turn-helix transcriptional regulator [Maricaulis sp.]|uniref:helix-turn-helix domain-containing protein n=1 Tax=Maricaulis sp. TaxID=1486257 RepID=UPI0026039899|nr:helix-turn-helix transcriptional regulator [Maricaulis sp.]
MDSFSDKLGLVLKTLVLSRTGLAAALNVDKSLVGRWVAGTVTPSEHNLAKLTRFVASRVDGFTMLAWEKDLPAFSRGLGVEAEEPAQFSAGPAGLIPPAIFQEGLRGAEMRAEAYEGFWRTTRPSSDVPGCYLRDITMVRRRPDGLMGWYTGVEGERFEGWSLLLGHQFFSIGWDPSHGTLMFAIFNGVARQKAEVVEGLSLANLRDAGSSPVCSACVMERVGELSGDTARDDADFDAQVRALDPLVPASAVPEEIRVHLARTVSDEVPGMMRMFFATSMARGPVLDPLDAK